MTSALIDGLSVVLLLAQDTEKTGAFYRDILGLALQEEEHDGRHKHYACRLGSVYFTIQSAADLSAPASRQGFDFLQLCFTTQDLNTFLEHLKPFGITPLHPARDFEHTRFTTLLDPDGRHVRVMTPWRRDG